MWESATLNLRVFARLPNGVLEAFDIDSVTLASARDWAASYAAGKGAVTSIALRSVDSSGRPGLHWLEVPARGL